MKKIVVTVDRRGNATVEASGYTGAECLEATRTIEEAIGKVSVRKDKPEMYHSAAEQGHEVSE